MIDIIIIFTLSCSVLFGSFYFANKRPKKPIRIAIKIAGFLFGLVSFILLTAILNTEFDTSSQFGAYYIFVVLILLFIQRNKFKEQ